MSWYFLCALCGVNVGRRFAEAEFVTALAMLTKRYVIELEEGWTREMVWDALNSSYQVLTMRIGRNVPLVFRKR